MKTAAIFAAFTFLALVAFGQPSANADSPIADLPAGVSPVPGKVALVADFAGSENQPFVSVYLINNWYRDIKLESQEGDVYLKLETLSDSGEWVRAQPHHFDRCGNSYWDGTLKTGQFLLIRGYRPKSGKAARVRYRLYNQEVTDLVTLDADGLVNESDIERASSDALAVLSGSFEFVVSVAIGERTVNSHVSSSRSLAIRALASGRFPSAKAVPVLIRMATESPELQSEIERALKRLDGRRKIEDLGLGDVRN